MDNNLKDEKKISVDKAVKIGILSVLLSILITFLITVFIFYKNHKYLFLMSEAEKLIDEYFYTDDVDKQKLIDNAMLGYVSGLEDKYSRYQNLSLTEERQDSQAGVTIGIGITITNSEDGFIKIVSLNDNSPASIAGLKADDIIIAIDSCNVNEVGYNESIEKIKTKEENSNVVLSVNRDGVISDFVVKVEKIDVITVEGDMKDNEIGYIHISQFNDNTPNQLEQVYSSLKDQGVKGIIFDLRNNGGGLVSSVERCLDPFLPEGDIAVAEYKNGKEEVIVKSDAKMDNIPAVILINSSSASGAELFSAAMRDFRNTKLIGVTSYGKGVMQNTFLLSDKSTIVLTVAKYRTTKSECYHGVGLIPDYMVENEDDQDKQFEKAMEIIKNEIS